MSARDKTLRPAYKGSVGAQIALLLWAMLDVRSTVACPAAADVSARLQPLLPRELGPTGDVVNIDAAGGVTTVRLVRSDGTLVAARALPRGESCAAQAQIAAVVVATWEGRLQAERADGALALPDPSTLGARASRPAPAPAWRLEIAGGPLAAFTGGDLGVALGADVAAFAAGSRWGIGAALLAIGDHEAPFVAQPGGTYTWRRLELGIGPAFGSHAGAWSLGVRAAAVVGLLDVRGSGFALDQRTTSFDLGTSATARLGYRVGPVSPWLGVTVVWWARPQRVQATFVEGVERLPAYEALAGAGLSWDTFF
jgi:hypothetical protein